MKFSTEAVVLRDYKLEGDRILTLLSREHGVITAFAGGANRIRSRLAGTTELLCYSHFVLFKNRERHSVDSADGIRSFFGLRSDVGKLSLASYFAELCAELCDRQGADACLRLLLNALHLLEKGVREPALIKAIFELRILTMAGYMPGLVACAGCSAYEADFMYFSPGDGDILCSSCAAGREHERAALPPGALAAMRHIIYSEPAKLYSFSLSGQGQAVLGRVCEKYLLYQLDRTFAALEFYRGVSGNPGSSV